MTYVNCILIGGRSSAMRNYCLLYGSFDYRPFLDERVHHHGEEQKNSRTKKPLPVTLLLTRETGHDSVVAIQSSAAPADDQRENRRAAPHKNTHLGPTVFRRRKCLLKMARFCVGRYQFPRGPGTTFPVASISGGQISSMFERRIIQFGAKLIF